MTTDVQLATRHADGAASLTRRPVARDIVNVAQALGIDPDTSVHPIGSPHFRMPPSHWVIDDHGNVVKPDARVILAAAAEAARKALTDTGRVVEDVQPRPYSRMTGRDMVSVADQAARATIAAMSRPALTRRQKTAGMTVSEKYRDAKLPNLSRDEYDALRADMVSHTVAAILTRGATIEERRAEHRHHGNRARAVLAVMADRERQARRQEGPRWADVYERLTGEARKTRDTDYRSLWTAWARNRCQDVAGEYLTHRNQLAATTVAQDRIAAAGRRVAAATVDGQDAAASILDALNATDRPLTEAERYGIACEIDGLTRRERAQRDGIALDSAKKRAQRGRAALTDRWPTVADFRADMRDARRAVSAAELDECGPVTFPAYRIGAATPQRPCPALSAGTAEAAWANLRNLTAQQSQRATVRPSMRRYRDRQLAQTRELTDALRMAEELSRIIPGGTRTRRILTRALDPHAYAPAQAAAVAPMYHARPVSRLDLTEARTMPATVHTLPIYRTEREDVTAYYQRRRVAWNAAYNAAQQEGAPADISGERANKAAARLERR